MMIESFIRHTGLSDLTPKLGVTEDFFRSSHWILLIRTRAQKVIVRTFWIPNNLKLFIIRTVTKSRR